MNWKKLSTAARTQTTLDLHPCTSVMKHPSVSLVDSLQHIFVRLLHEDIHVYKTDLLCVWIEMIGAEH